MKHTPVTKLCNYILVALGFTSTASCSDDPGLEIPQMYGFPHVEYRVSGKVVDQESNPIPGIRIHASGISVSSSSAEDGSFKVTGYGSEATLKFDDIDGEENGGEFASKEERVKLENAVSPEGYVYPDVYVATDVTITLEKK